MIKQVFDICCYYRKSTSDPTINLFMCELSKVPMFTPTTKFIIAPDVAIRQERFGGLIYIASKRAVLAISRKGYKVLQFLMANGSTSLKEITEIIGNVKPFIEKLMATGALKILRES